jgi:hypothetical protein
MSDHDAVGRALDQAEAQIAAMRVTTVTQIGLDALAATLQQVRDAIAASLREAAAPESAEQPLPWPHGKKRPAK